MPDPALSATPPSALQLAALACAVAFIAVALLALRRRDAHLAGGMDALRRLADALYRQTTLPNDEPRLAFDARTATVLLDEESSEGYGGGEYALTRYARNPEGEYFMFMFEVQQGVAKLMYSKVMEQHIARYVLGGKYIEPPLL